jgi:hypothetical protein
LRFISHDLEAIFRVTNAARGDHVVGNQSQRSLEFTQRICVAFVDHGSSCGVYPCVVVGSRTPCGIFGRLRPGIRYRSSRRNNGWRGRFRRLCGLSSCPGFQITHGLLSAAPLALDFFTLIIDPLLHRRQSFVGCSPLCRDRDIWSFAAFRRKRDNHSSNKKNGEQSSQAEGHQAGFQRR